MSVKQSVSKTAPTVKVGDQFRSVKGYVGTVVKYENNTKVHVEFPTGYVGVYHVANLRKGYLNDPLYPSVCGVGFLGVGEHTPSEDGKPTDAYTKWVDMIKRCYVDNQKDKFPTYVGVTVIPSWHNFQNFAEWVKKQRGYGEKEWHIDKDLIVVGNKVYSPETCSLVPRPVNNFFYTPRRFDGLPLGVRLSRGGYEASSSFMGKKHYIGNFDDPDQAHQAFLDFKRASAVTLIEMYKEVLDPRVLSTLVKFSEGVLEL